MVALKGLNEDEIEDDAALVRQQGHDLTLIETMPLGEVEEDRTEPLSAARRESGSGSSASFTLAPSLAGPAGRRAISMSPDSASGSVSSRR